MVSRFLELGSILEPGRPPKTDKSSILIDAVRMVTQLRGESQKLKDSNSSLQEKIKELKVRPSSSEQKITTILKYPMQEHTVSFVFCWSQSQFFCLG